MKGIINHIQSVMVVLGGIIGSFIGKANGILYALIIFAVVDYITGVLSAILNKELSSRVGFRGIAKKVCIFIVVGVANIIDTKIIGSACAVRSAVMFFYLSNEGISILENISATGLAIPEKIKNILEQIQSKGE